MHKSVRRALGAFGALLAAGSAQAAPIAVNATLRIEAGDLAFQVTGSGTVDVSGGVYTIPAGLVSLPSLTVPATATTAINSLVVGGVTNLSGTFAPGGVTSQAPAEICPVAAFGQACVSGGGLGGLMALDGSFAVHAIPHLVVFPLDLGVFLLGQGGSTNVPYTANGAPWTTGVAKVGFTSFGGPVTIFTTGGITGGSLSLVSASFVAACGNILPVTARFTLTPLVPEPAGLALIAIGAAGLIGLALRRR